MRLAYSEHWKLKRKYRQGITTKLLEYAISKGEINSDRRWENAYNAIARVPTSGRTLKVVFRRLGPKTYKVITAYWLD
jgi:hypothetical protein